MTLLHTAFTARHYLEEKTMPEEADPALTFSTDRYNRTGGRNSRHNSQLPRAPVDLLAKEVISVLANERAAAAPNAPGEREINLLCKALIGPDDRAGARFIQDRLCNGATIEAVYLAYLASAAKMLGAWWKEDRVSFTDVTLGTNRLHAVMLSLRGNPSPVFWRSQPAAFALAPGETHALGIRMATDLLRSRGWNIELKLGRTHEELVSEIAQTKVIGLSASSDRTIEALARLVSALRAKNPDAFIMLSGAAVESEQGKALLSDADALVGNIQQAHELMLARWISHR